MWNWITSLGSFGRERAIATADLPITDRRVKTAGGRYVALHKYLENRYADVIVLTFGQIEDLIGFALPQLARTYHAWWTLGQTNVDGPPHSDAWTLAGRTATPNLRAQTVLFERISTVKAGLQ
jgi:hypothetical protein